MRMRQETFKKSYYIPAFGKSIEIRRNQDIDKDGILGKELLAQYGEDCILEGDTKSLMEKIASGDIGGSGTSLTTEQTAALGKIEGLEASASKIDNSLVKKLNILDYGAVGGNATLDTSAFKAAILDCTGTMHNSLFIPAVEASYEINEEISLNGINNLTIYLDANMKVSDGVKLRAMIYAYNCKNINIVGSFTTLDGAGDTILDYTYSLADTDYNTCNFLACENVKITKTHFTNGLVGCLILSSVRNGTVRDCIFSKAVHDNGFSYNFSPVSSLSPFTRSTYNSTDSTTWSFGLVENCLAYDNTDFGFTAFRSGDITFRDCTSFNNGNDGTSYNVGGGYSAEANGLTDLDFRLRFLNCKALNSKGYGWRIDSSGVYIDAESVISNTSLGGTQNILGEKGNGISIIGGKGDNITINATIKNNAKNGVYLLSSSGDANALKNITINGVISNNVEEGIKGRGINKITIGADINNNGGFTAVDLLNHANYNLGKGDVTFSNARLSSNARGATVIDGFNEFSILNTYSKDNCKTTGSNDFIVQNTNIMILLSLISMKNTSTGLATSVNVKNTVNSFYLGNLKSNLATANAAVATT